MKAIILAAGRGSRMKNLTEDCPKCLLEFRGKPLLQWQLDALIGAGINDIAIVAGYRSELLLPYGLKMFKNEKWATTQMVTSLACASEWLTSDTCIVSYSDIFYSKDVICSLASSQTDISITYDPNWLNVWGKRFENPLDDAETFKISENAQILEIGNKPKTIEEVGGQFMGLLKFTPKGWESVQTFRNGLINEMRDKIDMTSMLKGLVSEGYILTGVPIYSEWGEVDSEEDIARLK